MRSLAEFMMRGRAQAGGVAILGGVAMIPVISQAALGLTTLRKGPIEGLLITLLACVPGVLFVLSGMDTWSGKAFIAAVLLLTWLHATILRSTVSLPLTCWVAMFTGAVSGILLVWALPEIVEEVNAAVAKVLEDLRLQNSEITEGIVVLLSGYTAVKTAGMLAFTLVWMAVPGLFVARWLQAQAYNPGGFQQEFHNFRLNTPLVLIAVIGLVGFSALGSEYWYWAGVCTLPIVLNGISVLHFFAKRHKAGTAFLVVFYLVAVVITHISGLIALVAGVTDPFLNHRERFSKNSSSS